VRNSLRLLTLTGAATLMAATLLPPAAAGASSFRDEALSRLGVLEKKFVGLAEAMPAEKYTWRPGEGVRSVSEVYLHIAGANFGMPRMIGTPPPADFNMRGYDKSTTDKAEIVKRVKASFAHVRQAIEKISAADMDKPVKMFGRETTTRNAVLAMLEHLSEHLGQSIAYARVNGVAPPWSQGQRRGM